MHHLMAAILALALPAEEEGCSARHGTAIEWEESIGAAAEAAREDGKLVLVLHVSGVFSDPALT